MVVVAIVVLQALFGSGHVSGQRAALLDQFQQQRNSHVIAMIHREETVSLLGVPVSKFIDIEDSEAVLRAIRLTPPDQPIDLILHTAGGLVLAAEQIAHALINPCVRTAESITLATWSRDVHVARDSACW